MNPESINQLIDFSTLMKIAFLMFIFFHSIFLIVIYYQINSMDKVVKVAKSSSVLKTVSLAAIIFNVSLFVIAIVIL